jgi:GTP-binding protein EngB required for normal cell division
MSAQSERLAALKEICGRRALSAVVPQINACEKLLSAEGAVNIAVLGKFKAGKSSFLNALSGKEALPVGVVPVTAVITELFWAPEERASVKFLDGDSKVVPVSAVKTYVSEELNPKNRQGAALVEIGLPSLAAYKGARLVDTPGLDSTLRHNTETSLEWLPNTGLALIAVSSDAPLSDQDLGLIEATRSHSPRVAVLLTKADRLTPAELEQVLAFVRSKVEERFGGGVPVFPFSVKEEYSSMREDFTAKALTPFLKDMPGATAKIIDHKINSMKRQCTDYLLAAKAAASKAAAERAALKELAAEQRRDFDTLKKDFKVIYASMAGAARQEIEQIVLAHRAALERALRGLIAEKLSVPLNLLQMVRVYNATLEAFFAEQTRSVFEAEQGRLARISGESAGTFLRMADDFTARLSMQAEKALAVRLPRSRYESELGRLPVPDVKVSQAFDSHLELLWFLIPARLFRRPLLRHFTAQLPFETEKNLTRLAMGLAETVNAGTQTAMLSGLTHAEGVLDTVERVLSSTPEELGSIEADLQKI